MTVEHEVVTTVSLASCSSGPEPAPQQNPISCATNCHQYRNVTVPKEGSYCEWWGPRYLVF